MSITLNADMKAIVGAANTRPDEEQAEKLGYEAAVKKLGSRVTSRQGKIIAEVMTAGQLVKLAGDDEAKQNLRLYADTGDKSHLTPEQNEVLTQVVKAARERALNDTDNGRVKGESQARRIWPRKVSAIVLNLADQPVVTPASETQEGEGNEGEQSGEQPDGGNDASDGETEGETPGDANAVVEQVEQTAKRGRRS
jgi:hypothetical protein